MDLAKMKAEREERERLERIEKELVEQRIRQETLARENILRVVQLVESGNIFNQYDHILIHVEDSKETFEHEIYVECRNIPDLAKLNDVNSFYVDWINQVQSGQIGLKIVFQNSPPILKLVDEMQEFLQLPPDTSNIEILTEMGLIYHDFCEMQQKFIDQGTYNIMIDLRGLFDPELGVFENSLSTEEIVHSLWGNLYSCSEYRGHFFESLNFRFRLPDSLVMVKGIYRLLKTEYDHYSHTSNSYYPPNVENFHRLSIKNWLMKKSLQTDVETKVEEIPPIELQTPAVELSGMEATKQNWGLVKIEEKTNAPSLADLLSKETLLKVTEGMQQLPSAEIPTEQETDQIETIDSKLEAGNSSMVVIATLDQQLDTEGKMLTPEIQTEKDDDGESSMIPTELDAKQFARKKPRVKIMKPKVMQENEIMN